LEVFHEPVRICPIAVRDAKDRAGRARDAGLGKGAFDRHLGAICALGNDLEEKQGGIKQGLMGGKMK
jgi:hypothetical protein